MTVNEAKDEMLVAKTKYEAADRELNRELDKRRPTRFLPRELRPLHDRREMTFRAYMDAQQDWMIAKRETGIKYDTDI